MKCLLSLHKNNPFMATKNITVIPGDGIGPEVIAQAVNVLDAVALKFGHQFKYCYAEMGACAIGKYGEPLPEETVEACIAADAVLFGAIGHPKYDNDPNAKVRPEQGLLALRKSLGLYANIRPVTAYASLIEHSPLRRDLIEGVDFVIYRELTGGIYFGEKGREVAGTAAFDTCYYTKSEIERIAHLAFQAAKNRRNKVTLIDKANVLETSRLWRETIKRLHTEYYEEVELDFLFVDNAAMQMILYPKQFDVIVTSNMFGDIISDEASVISGSMGLLPSASVGEKTALFEPIHGSYPQAAGQDIANPTATILSAAMLLDHLKMHEEAQNIRDAVSIVLEAKIGTADLHPEVEYSCSQMGDLIASMVAEDGLSARRAKLEESISTII